MVVVFHRELFSHFATPDVCEETDTGCLVAASDPDTFCNDPVQYPGVPALCPVTCGVCGE